MACAVSKYWCEVVAHAGDQPPRDGWLGGQQIVRQCFDSFADLQQAEADRVEDQPVGQIAALQVGADRADRGPGYRPAADAPGNSERDNSERDQVRLDSFTDARFEVGGGDQVDPGAEDAFEVSLDAAQPEQAQPRRKVGEQVHVTIGAVFAAGHAAEHTQVTDPVRCCGGDQVLAVAADAAAHRPRQPAQPAGRPAQAQRQLEAGRIDQPGERWDGRLPLPGLVRTDHALRDTRPDGQVHLGQAGPLARLAE